MKKQKMLNFVLVVFVLLTGSGCSTMWAKGTGSLYETHTYIGRAPMVWGAGANHLFGKASEQEGPADIVASNNMNPMKASVHHTLTIRREARD